MEIDNPQYTSLFGFVKFQTEYDPSELYEKTRLVRLAVSPAPETADVDVALLNHHLTQTKLATAFTTSNVNLPAIGKEFYLRINGEALCFDSQFHLAVPVGLLKSIATTEKTGLLLESLNKDKMGVRDIRLLTKQQYEDAMAIAEVEEDTTVAALKKHVKLLVHTVDNLEKRNKELEEENAALKVENAALKVENAALKMENASLTAKVDRLETEVAELKEIVKQLSSALDKVAK